MINTLYFSFVIYIAAYSIESICGIGNYTALRRQSQGLSGLIVMIEAFFFLIGLIIGSFLNVCIYRIPRGISIIKPSSFCPECKRPIKFYDNIPIISYILLKGKCRYCKNPISIQYPLIEFITGTFSLILLHKYGAGFEYIIYMVFISSLIIVSIIDIHHQIIPDIITIPGMITGILLSFLHSLPVNAIAGLILGGGLLLLISLVYSFIAGKEGMGGGDIKLMGMIGAWLGLKAIFPVIILASLSGTFAGIILIMIKGRKVPIPFGPFLSAAAVCYLIFQHLLLPFIP